MGAEVGEYHWPFTPHTDSCEAWAIPSLKTLDQESGVHGLTASPARPPRGIYSFFICLSLFPSYFLGHHDPTLPHLSPLPTNHTLASRGLFLQLTSNRMVTTSYRCRCQPVALQRDCPVWQSQDSKQCVGPSSTWWSRDLLGAVEMGCGHLSQGAGLCGDWK